MTDEPYKLSDQPGEAPQAGATDSPMPVPFAPPPEEPSPETAPPEPAPPAETHAPIRMEATRTEPAAEATPAAEPPPGELTSTEAAPPEAVSETPSPPQPPSGEPPPSETTTMPPHAASEGLPPVEPPAGGPIVPEVVLPEPVAEVPAPAEPAAETPAPAEPVPTEAITAERPERPKKAAKAREKAKEVEQKPAEPKSENLEWYILKVQSNREDSIREGLLRRVAIAGLDRYFDEVIVPTEKVTEFKGGKKRVTKRKLYPGYLVVHMEINDDTWFLVRETPGIGDFTGAAGRPSPMLPHEVSRILAKHEEKSEKAPKLKIGFSPGDQVKITEGTFENFEGEVESIDETNGQVTVMINIFGRSTPVTLEYWQIGAV